VFFINGFNPLIQIPILLSRRGRNDWPNFRRPVGGDRGMAGC